MRRSEVATALTVVVLLLSGAWRLDRLIPARPAGRTTAPATPGPLSEAWYCPVPSALNLGSTISTANLGTGSAHLRRSGTADLAEVDAAPGTLTGVTSAPAPAKGPVTVEAFGQSTASSFSVLHPTIGGTNAWCSQQPGTRWLFAVASTAPGYDTYLLVANPFQEEAVVTARVLGPQGDQVPSGLNDVEVPPASQVVLFLGDYYPQTPLVGLDVTASRGRVVVGRLLKVAARGGVRGVALDVGAPAPSTRWILPGGEVPSRGEEDLVVANPSDHEALVSLVYQTEGGSAPAGSQDHQVPAGSQVIVKMSEEVPGGTRHGTILTSTNGVPVVAERMTIQGSGTSQSFQDVFGVAAGAARWVVPAGSVGGGTDTLGIVADGGAKAVCRITIMKPGGPDPPPDLQRVEVEAGQRASVDLTPHLGGQPAMVLVEAVSGRVAVENDLALPSNFRETMESRGVPIP